MRERARPRREFAVDRRRWLAIDAWRDSGDLGLCYLLPLENGAPAAADREDRRATLEPGQALDSLDGAALERLWRMAVPLTETERRFIGPDGAVWLARNTGPVWADASGAADSIGVVIRCLTSVRPDIEVAAAGPVRDETPGRLCKMLAGGDASS